MNKESCPKRLGKFITKEVIGKMIIHTVEAGDTIFKIARKYSVQPTKIIEDNGLESDRLSVGQELLILLPTRTATVRGGDTIASIARRFGVRKSTILANNPGLKGKEKLRPGHILSIKYDAPRGNAASAVGFCRGGCSESKFIRALPYLTYVVFECVKICKGNELKSCFDASRLRSVATVRGKLTLLGFYDETNGEFLKNENHRALIDAMISIAKAGKYGGIYLSTGKAAGLYPEEFASFLMDARKQLIGCDLILFSSSHGLTCTTCAELSDGAILKDDSDNGLTDSKRLELCEFAENSETIKSFLFIDCAARSANLKMTGFDALKLARQYGAELKFRENELLSYFNYRRYMRGVGEDVEIRIPQLTITKAKLQLVCELGFMGIAFDIESAPVWLLSLFNTYFSRADFSILSAE